MLAILERLITGLDGTYAFCDTDSMAIVATERGELIPCPRGRHTKPDGREAIQALSRTQVAAIVERFQALKPYDPNVIPESILKIEDVNFARVEPGSDKVDRDYPLQLCAYAISPKRYALYNLTPGGPDIRDYKEHGLGYLLNPLDPDDPQAGSWIRDVWAYIVSVDALGQDAAERAWLLDSNGNDRIAMGQLTFSTADLMDSIDQGANAQRVTSILPHTFVLTPHAAPGGHPIDADPTRFQLLAGYTKNPHDWPALECIEKHTGRRYLIAAAGDDRGETRPANVVYLKTYRQVLNDYRRNANPTGIGADRQTADANTIGLLRPRPVHVIDFEQIGAETKLADAMAAKTIHDEDESLRIWRDGRKTLSPHVRKVLLSMSVADGAQLSGLSEKTIKRVRHGPVSISEHVHEKLELGLPGGHVSRCYEWGSSRRAEICSAGGSDQNAHENACNVTRA